MRKGISLPYHQDLEAHVGLPNPIKEAAIKQANSQHVTAHLVLRIIEQDEKMSDIQEQLKHLK